MSTKRLRKTILEGGRVKSCRMNEHYNTKSERAAVRAEMSKAAHDFEYDVDVPERKKDFREFTDKLKPVYRFLDSKVGKGWNNIRSEIAEKFDVRSLAGHHIVNQHMFASIKGAGHQETSSEYGYYNYYVDDRGIFRKAVRKAEKFRYNYYRDRQDFIKDKSQKVVEWLNRNKVGMVGGVLFWFVPTNVKAIKIEYTWRGFNYLDSSIFGQTRFRQSYKLNKKEVNYFIELPEWVKENLLKQSPVYKEKVAA